MSHNQAGGRKCTATVDHLAILNEAIKETRKKNSLYGIPGCNKAWLDAIMYVMHKEGLNTAEWAII